MDDNRYTGIQRRSGIRGHVAASSRLITMACLLMFVPGMRTEAQPAGDQSALPLSGGDQVSVVDPHTGEVQTLTGRVDDLVGNRLMFRSNRTGREQLLRLQNVTRMQLATSADFETGLQLRRFGRLRPAIVAFQTALNNESRPWVRREIRADLAKTMVQAGDRRTAIDELAKIFEDDQDTRHVGLLPLVWDVRLPAEHRLSADVTELNSSSPPKRLAAASALLHDPQHTREAEQALVDLGKSRHAGVSLLAGCQLWRLKLLTPSPLQNVDVQIWRRRVASLPHELRPGPQYLLGRGSLLLHDYDRAARAFLWMPLMAPLDPALTALSLDEAVNSLKLAGRHDEAAALAVSETGK